MWIILFYDGVKEVKLYFADYGKAAYHKGRLTAIGKTVIGPDVECIGCG